MVLIAVAAEGCQEWCEHARCVELNGNVENECGDCPSSHQCWQGAEDYPPPPPRSVGPPPSPRGGPPARLSIEELWPKLAASELEGPCPESRPEQDEAFRRIAADARSCDPAALRPLLCSLAGRPGPVAAELLATVIAAAPSLGPCLGLVAAASGLEVGRNLAAADLKKLTGLIEHQDWNVRLGGGELLAAQLPASLVLDGQGVAVRPTLAQEAAEDEMVRAVVQAEGEAEGGSRSAAGEAAYSEARRGERVQFHAYASHALANVIESYDMSCRWIAVHALERMATTWRLRGEPEGADAAAREFRARLRHRQPGTQWMAIKALSIFEPQGLGHSANHAESLEPLLAYFADAVSPAGHEPLSRCTAGCP